MCMFSCSAGETIHIGDEVSLRIRAPDDRPILLAVEWTGDTRIPVEVVPSTDENEGAALRIVDLGIPA
jgi:hypothetical protein